MHAKSPPNSLFLGRVSLGAAKIFRCRTVTWLLILKLTSLLSISGQSADSNQTPYLNQPEELKRALEKRSKQQFDAAKDLSTFHDFGFKDGFAASKIQFQHYAVDDAGKYYKPVHYDHGNGLAVADIDGDGLLDIYFTTQLGTNRLYRNLGGGKFEDITERAGVGLPDQIAVTASFADVDNDGLPDLFVTTVRHGNHLFRNLGQDHFEEIGRAH